MWLSQRSSWSRVYWNDRKNNSGILKPSNEDGNWEVEDFVIFFPVKEIGLTAAGQLVLYNQIISIYLV